MAQLVKNLPTMWETMFNSWVGKIPWRREFNNLNTNLTMSIGKKIINIHIDNYEITYRKAMSTIKKKKKIDQVVTSVCVFSRL